MTCAAVLLVAGCAVAPVERATPVSPAAPTPQPAADAPALKPTLEPALTVQAAPDSPEAVLGIHITALRVSAGGYMIDLRYRVVDPERARPLLDRRVQVHLADEASGAKLGVPSTPKLGRLRPGNANHIKTDRDYGMLFGNPGQFLRPGARVTLVAGDVRVPALVVQ